MRRFNFRLLALAALLTLAYYGLNAPKVAAATQSDNGITVSPALLRIELKADQTTYPVDFRITNSRPVTQTLHLSSQDFNALEDTGGLLFVGTNPTDIQKKYGLAKWLRLSQDTLTLAPHQTTTIMATIDNRGDLTPGGHYGALMLSLDQTGGGGNAVAVQPIASVLMFVNKAEGDTHYLILDKVKANSNIFSLPKSVTLYFRSQGNSHVIPRGTIEIKNSRGKLIARGIINQESAIILPEHSRSYNVKLQQMSPALLPGHYPLSVNYRFDGYESFRTYQKTYFILTPWGLVFLAILSASIILIWRKPKWIIKPLTRLKKGLF